MTRVCIIQGHPTAGGGHFCHALAEAYSQGVPIVEAVHLSFFTKLLDPDTGRFDGGEAGGKAANVML